MADFLKLGGTVACVTDDTEFRFTRKNYCGDICTKVGPGNCIWITEDKTWNEKKMLESFKSDTKLIILTAIQNEFDQNIPHNTTTHITMALHYMKEIGLSVLIPISSETWKKKEFEFTHNSSLEENGASDHQYEGKMMKIHYFKLS